MILQILHHTPAAVWALLAGLVALGLVQTRPRRIRLARATLPPLALTGLALYGVVGAFGFGAGPLLGWAAGVAATLAIGHRAAARSGACWQPATGLLQVPGSWWPLALILVVFALRYAVAVTLAIEPSLAARAPLAIGCSVVYGGLSGVFLARTLALLGVRRRALAGATVSA